MSNDPSAMLSVISDFETGTYTVTRQGEGDYVKGRWVAGAETTLDCPGSLQPMSGVSTEDLPEGVSTSDTRTLFTAVELKGPRKGVANGEGADRILIGTEMFRVWKVEHFGILSDHYRVQLMRESVTGSGSR